MGTVRTPSGDLTLTSTGPLIGDPVSLGFLPVWATDSVMATGTGFGDVDSVRDFDIGIIGLPVDAFAEVGFGGVTASSKFEVDSRSCTALAFFTPFFGLSSLFLSFVFLFKLPGVTTGSLGPAPAFAVDSPDPRKSLRPDLEGVRFNSVFFFPIASFPALAAFFFPIPSGGFTLNSWMIEYEYQPLKASKMQESPWFLQG